jgi:hypothetical protein
LQGEGGQPLGKCKDHMDVAGGEKVLAASRQPAVASRRLTLGGVPIAAANGVLSISCVGLNRYRGMW